MAEANGKYVTYKILLAGLGTTIVILLTIGMFTYQAVTNKIDQRVSLELYKSETARLCADVNKIATAVEENANKLTEVVVHQRLVLQKLGIPYTPITPKH